LKKIKNEKLILKIKLRFKKKKIIYNKTNFYKKKLKYKNLKKIKIFSSFKFLYNKEKEIFSIKIKNL
jgi:hypothetical protein